MPIIQNVGIAVSDFEITETTHMEAKRIVFPIK